MKNKPDFKLCKTVGQLIAELQKLPKTAKLDEPVRPIHYNTSDDARALGLKPKVGFEEY